MSEQQDTNVLFPIGKRERKEDHPIFSRDPSEWLKLLHKQVCVFTDDGIQHRGWVFTVDPVSESVVLIDNPDDNLENHTTVNLKLLIGSSITKITSESYEASDRVKHFCDCLFRPVSNVSLTEEEILSRRTKLKAWLEKHRLPVTMGQDRQSLIVADTLVIQSPFSEKDCLGTNEIILSKIQGLIQNMPVDQDSW